MTLTDEEGNDIGLSKSASEVEAMEKASRLPDGTYLLIRPAATIRVDQGAVGVPPPVIDPPPVVIPPTGDIPFGDIPALQALGLLPEYFLTGDASVDTNINWSGTAGDRPEIGWIPNDHAAVVAGRHDLLQGILDVAHATIPPSNLDYAHTPCIYWLPFLMTGDPVFVERMEIIHNRYMAYRKRPLGESYSTKSSGRELAWQLRNLGHLVYLEDRGYTTEKSHRATMEKTRDMYLATVNNPPPRVALTGVFAWAFTDYKSFGHCHWMNAFLGHVIGMLVKHGFDDWRPIATFFYGNLKGRIDHWGWKGFDAEKFRVWSCPDYSAEVMAFRDPPGDATNTVLYSDQLHWGIDPADKLSYVPMSVLEHPMHESQKWRDWPADQIVAVAGPDSNYDGLRITYADRTGAHYMWMAVSAEMDIHPDAHAHASYLYQQINARGDTWLQKQAVVGPQ